MALPWSIPSEGIGWLPQLLLICFYGYILLKASQTISAGSEMLLLLYGPGIIGGLVIPLLGAVPDAAMILVSGVGPRDEVQDQLSVGVGTLAGSTIMLLTLPWAAGVFLARRDLDPNTGEAASYTTASGAQKPKLTHFSLTTNVVTTFDSIPKMSKIMMVTALSYLIIQIPAFADKHDPDAAGEERPFALAGFIITVIALFAYSGYQLYDARNDQIVEEKKREADRKRWQGDLSNKLQRMGSDIHKVFHQFDHDHSGFLDREELAEALQTLGLEVDRQELNKMVSEMDSNKDGRVSEDEFVTVFTRWVEASTSHKLRHGAGSSKNLLSPKAHHDQKTPVANIDESSSINAGVSEPLLGEVNEAVQLAVAAASADDDEEEEEEDDFTALTDTELFRKAMFLLMGGTAMVTIFSDPMVDVIENFGDTIGISPFYIAFCVNPISSNASEVISALIFAKKKTNRGISLTFASLYGAACMNNTLGLAIFMALVYFRNLTWTFSAEVISILIVIGVVGVNGLFKTVRLWQAILVAFMFPLSLILVASMEKAGLDN